MRENHSVVVEPKPQGVQVVKLFGLVPFSFQFFTRLAAVFAEEVGNPILFPPVYGAWNRTSAGVRSIAPHALNSSARGSLKPDKAARHWRQATGPAPRRAMVNVSSPGQGYPTSSTKFGWRHLGQHSANTSRVVKKRSPHAAQM